MQDHSGPLNIVVKPARLAEILGVTSRRVRQLAAEGVLTREAGGGYRLAPTVRAYLLTLDRAPDPARSGLQDARRREVEARTAERARLLIDRREHVELLDELCGLFVAGLDSLEKRLARLPLRRDHLAQEIEAIRTRVREVVRVMQAQRND